MNKFLLNQTKINISVKKKSNIMKTILIKIASSCLLLSKKSGLHNLNIKLIYKLFRWKQGEVLGYGSFGKVILGFNKDTG